MEVGRYFITQIYYTGKTYLILLILWCIIDLILLQYQAQENSNMHAVRSVLDFQVIIILQGVFVFVKLES